MHGFLDKWSEYGFEGLIVGALLFLVYLIVKMFFHKFEKTVTSMLSTFSETNQQLRNEQIDERKEWLRSQEYRDEKLNSSIKDLASAIREDSFRQTLFAVSTSEGKHADKPQKKNQQATF